MGRLLAGAPVAVFCRRTRADLDPKHIYLAPDDHTDLFWTATDDAYQQAFLEMLDYYLDLADQTAAEPASYQSRWNCDGHYWMWVYEKHKPAADFARLIARIKDGHISVPLNALCVCLGGAPAEAVIRGMYYPGQIERRYNLRFRLAYAVENQTLPYGLGALWAGAGARYSWKGICGCATRVPDAGDRQHEVYWWTGPDGSQILMKWNTMDGDNRAMGGYAEARDPAGVVDYVDGSPTFLARYAYRIIGAFGKGWDDFKTLVQEFPAVARAKTTPARSVIVSNEEDFFVDFEARYGASLPSLSCSFGNEWELDCATMAEVAARAKRAVEKLRGAEAVAALVSLCDPHFMRGRTAARDLAWMNLGLFWEHDWLGRSDNGIDLVDARIQWQRRITAEIEAYVDDLYSAAQSALGSQIRKTGPYPRYYAFNPLGWQHTDYVDFPYDGPEECCVFDLTTGRETPSQWVSAGGNRLLRILAGDVPPVGYKVYEIRPGLGQEHFEDAAAASEAGLENARWRLTVAENGAITSLQDKTMDGREFVNAVNNRRLNDLGPGAGVIQLEHTGPVTTTLRVTSSGPAAHTTRITLIRGLPRIEIQNEITQNFDATLTWGFGLNLTPPDVWHEEVGAVIRARLTTQGGHYSPRSARYDWLTLNHFVDMSCAGAGITLSNADCYYMQLGGSYPQMLDTTTPLISVLVGGRDPNGSQLIMNQGGDTHFLQRFALRTHRQYDPVEAMRFSLEHQNPLVAGAVAGGSQYPEQQFSLLSVSNPNILLWALKPAEDGPATTLTARLWNLAGSAAPLRLLLDGGRLRSAQHATHIETPTGPAAVSGGALNDSFLPQQIKTYLLDCAASSQPKYRNYMPVTRI